MQLRSILSHKGTVFAVAFLAIEITYLAILFAICHQTEVEMQRQLRSKAIISQSNTLSKLIYDAGIAVAGYSLTKNQLLSDRYQKISQQIPQEVNDLRATIGSNDSEQQIIGNLNETTTSALEILNESKSQADANQFDVTQVKSRQMYKEIRLLADRLTLELSQLIEHEGKVAKESAKANGQCQLALNIFFALGFVLNIALAIALARCQRL
jgi:CHASE3 domain sensor protein